MSEKLTVQKRLTLKKKSKRLRHQGIVPAVIYGYAFDNLNIQLDAKKFTEVYKKVGRTGFIDLALEKKTFKVLVKKVEKSIKTHSISHIDFYALNEKKPVKLFVPVKLINESPLLSKGCLLVKGLDKIYLEALPKNIPSEIRVDLSKLTELGKPCLISDLALSTDLRILSPLGARLASMVQTRALKSQNLEEEEEEIKEEKKKEKEQKEEEKTA